MVGTLSADGKSEVPRAYIVCQAGADLSAKDVYNFTRQRLASYKKLEGGVVFVYDIPRTASGKTQRYKLAEMSAEVHTSFA